MCHNKSMQNTRLVMHELNSSGDTVFEFSVNDDDDIIRAEMFFDKKISEGFTAYYVDPFDLSDGIMTSFDKKVGKIIFVPPVKAGYPSPPQ